MAAPGMLPARTSAARLGKFLSGTSIDSAGEGEFAGCRYGAGRIAQELPPDVNDVPGGSPQRDMAHIFRRVGDASILLHDLPTATRFHNEILKLALVKV